MPTYIVILHCKTIIFSIDPKIGKREFNKQVQNYQIFL